MTIRFDENSIDGLDHLRRVVASNGQFGLLVVGTMALMGRIHVVFRLGKFGVV